MARDIVLIVLAATAAALCILIGVGLMLLFGPLRRSIRNLEQVSHNAAEAAAHAPAAAQNVAETTAHLRDAAAQAPSAARNVTEATAYLRDSARDVWGATRVLRALHPAGRIIGGVEAGARSAGSARRLVNLVNRLVRSLRRTES